MSLFDDALLARFVDSSEAVAVTSADTLLIRDNETGLIFKLQVSVLTNAINAAVPVQSVAGKTGTVTLNKTDVGLSNVDNTADSSKSVSYAASAGSAPASDVYSWAKASTKPTYSKSEVGLANVDDTSDANKPVSTAQATAIAAKANASIEAFSNPSLLNSWVNYDDVSWRHAAYYKDNFGIVRVTGLVKNGTSNQPIMQLPAGCRPSKGLFFAVTAAGAFGSVSIDASGNVSHNSGSNAYFSLDGICFRAEA